MLERLTLNNMYIFKEMYNKNLSRISYNKDFFRYYKEQNFLLKFMYRKFIRLIKIKNDYIGYIWYEGTSTPYVKIWALYIDPSYIDLVNESLLSYFDNNILSYEEIDLLQNNIILSKLGFKKDNNTLLLKMDISKYNEKNLSFYLNDKFKNNYSSTINKNEDDIITIRKFCAGKDELLRCNIQNDVFSQWNRRPLSVDDIYSDITQEYYLNDFCFFGMIKNEYLGYGQIIFNRNMYTIVNFGIVNKYRGMGLSKVFLSKIIKYAKERGIKDLYIRVDLNNIKAINLYRTMGFKDLNNIIIWERSII